MKKQGEFYLKLISILLAVLLLVYGCCTLIFDGEVSYALRMAAYCEVGDGITVSGFVVRSERYILSDAPIVVSTLAEGEWVGKGQSVAVGYANATTQTARQELLSLQRQRAQLLLAGDVGDTASLDEELSGAIVDLALARERQDFGQMSSLAAQIEPLALRRCVTGEDEAAVKDRIARLDERIFSLIEQTTGNYTTVTAETAGYFSSVVDGYETILNPTMLQTLNLAQLRSLDKQTAAVPQEAVGRLITGQTWYYVTEVPVTRLADYAEGDRLDVSFSDAALKDLRMTISFIGEPEGENCLLVLSCGKKMQEVTSLRYQSAQIEFSSYAGLRVPKAALHQIGEETGVYILSGARAKWKPVEILYEYGDDCLVTWDSSNTDNLWPKDEIILSAEELTDGMVIE